MFKITYNHESFICPETMSIVEAAKIQTARIPHGCNGGGCGICKMKIIEGKYKMNPSAAKALTEEEKTNGHAFLCQTYPQSDLHIESIKK